MNDNLDRKPEIPAAGEARFEVVNVCCTFKTHCHLDLRKICMMGANVELKRDPPSVRMKLRCPPVTASIWSPGKVMVVGAKSEEESLLAARRVARKIQLCGFAPHFVEFKIVNSLSVVYLPFGVRIDRLKDAYPRQIEYEPEMSPMAIFTLAEVGGRLQCPQTGNMTITAPNIQSARATLKAAYPMLEEFRKPKDVVSQADLRKEATKRRLTSRAAAKLPGKQSAKRWKSGAPSVDEELALMEELDEDNDDSDSD